MDGIFRADLRALMGKASLTCVGHDDLFFRACVACEFDDVDQRIIIVFFSDRAFFDPIGKRGLFLHAAQRQADPQTKALSDDGAFQEDAVAVARLMTRQDLVRELLDLLGIVSSLICQSGDSVKTFRRMSVTEL